jgi:acetyl esterase/lipase
MDSNPAAQFEIDIEDVEYLRHGTSPLLATVYKPRGPGPFPLVLDLHGGAWCNGSRQDDACLDEPLARSGVVVVGLDFRQPPDASYPGSMVDINYAIRWFKINAARFNARADRIGVMGISSGGQQAILGAMRHDDPRYAALPSPAGANADATVQCVILCWPVIDPLGRYEYAKRLIAENSPHAEVGKRVIPSHDKYWGSEAAMSEGSPTRALERGERGPMPPVIYLQGTDDLAHPRPNLDRFVAAYRQAGGQVDLHFFEGVGEAFVKKDPNSAQSKACIGKIAEFVHRQLG